MPKKSNEERDEPEVVGFIGVGLDNQDGHHRTTRGDRFVLLGGSEETHEHMTETAIHIAEKLQQQGKLLSDATVQEVLDLFRAELDRE